MKYIILMFTTIAIVFNLSACGKSEKEEKKESALSNFKATPAPDPKNYKTPKL